MSLGQQAPTFLCMDLNKNNMTEVFRYEEDRRKYIERLNNAKSFYSKGDRNQNPLNNGTPTNGRDSMS